MIRTLRACLLLAIGNLICWSAHSQIQVSENKRFLTDASGQPFFWLGDTDWELFHRLTREEAVEVINVRSSQGFNVLQAVALAEFNGIRQPNRYGDYPLNNEDPTQLLITPGSDPNNAYEYDYWDHVDYIIGKAAEKGIFIGLLPTWGDKVTPMWGEGPRIFDEQNAKIYGATLGKRYSNQRNIIWILGGDRPAVYKKKLDGIEKQIDDRPIWRAMATGIEEALGTSEFITYHPTAGPERTSTYLQDERWLDLNAFQSGHGTRDVEPWRWAQEDLAFKPQRPTLDMEPCYEDHPVNPWDGKWTKNERGYFSAYDVRARIYRGVFAGGCGVTYGHHHVWQFMDTELNKPVNVGDTIIPWRTALKAEAATQMQFLKKLMLSRPYFTRIHDESVIHADPGTGYTDLVVATRDENKTYAMIYLPQNKAVRIDLSKISGAQKNVWWYDPRTGVATKGISARGNSVESFTPPKIGKDWVLVIDDASKKFGVPGK